jgi:phage terminase small subunit
MKGLTELQRKFIDNYVATGQGAQSARLAGYKKGAAVRACNLLKRQDVQEEINDRQVGMRIRAGLEMGHLIEAGMDSFLNAKAKGSTMGMLKSIDLIAKLSGLYPKK